MTFNESGRALEGHELAGFLRGHDKAITALERLDDALFAALPELRVIGKYGVGLDMIDLSAMRRHGVRLGWTGGVNRQAVAELVIAFAISLLRCLPAANGDLRSGIWRTPVGRHLSGRCVGIVGCGHVGKEVALYLRPFGCRLLAYDIIGFPKFYRAHGIEAVDLDTLLRTAEIVTLHLPLDSSTAGMLDARRLSLMRPDAILINTARGGLVDEIALEKMLRDKRLAGAAFDVFSTEPPERQELLSMPNFFGTPHLGAGTEEAILAMGRAAIRGLEQNRIPEPGVYPEGAWPASPMDADRPTA